MRLLISSAKLNRKIFLLSIFLAWTCNAHAEKSGPDNFAIKNVPLFMGANIVPNFYILLDDSESMDAEVMAQPHWSRAAYDKTAVDISMPMDEQFNGKNTCDEKKDCSIKPLDTDRRICCCNPDMDCSIEKKYDGLITINLSDTDKLAYDNINKFLGHPEITYKGNRFASNTVKYAPFGFLSHCRIDKSAPAYQNCKKLSAEADNIDKFGCFTTSSTAFSAANCPATENLDWRLRSADVNTLFYNPRENYKPWQSYTDANFKEARNNPYNYDKLMPGYNIINDLGGDSKLTDPNIGRDPTSCAYDIKGNITCGADGFVYYIWKDDKGFDKSDGYPRRGVNVNVTDTPNGEVDLWDSHYKVTVTNNNIKVQLVSCNVDEDTGDLNCCGASGGGSPPCPPAVTGKDLGALLDSLGAPFTVDRCADKHPCNSFEEEKKNIANWYQYSHRRSMIMKQAVAEFISQAPYYRYALDTFYNALKNKNINPEPLIPFPADGATPVLEDIAKLKQHSDRVIQEVYRLYDTNRYYDISGPGTPGRLALDRAGRYYKSKNAPTAIAHACQRNFTVLISDGWWDNTDSLGDKSLADIAKEYYENDLRDDLDDWQVPSTDDPQTTQHMVTFTVGLGVDGKLQDKDPRDGWPDNIVTDSSKVWGNACNDCWGNPTSPTCASATYCAEKIDDLWHAAYNSHGRYYSAKSVTDLVNQLTDILKITVPDFSTGAASGVSQRFVGANFSSFVPGFTKKGNDWVGFLKSYNMDSTLKWEASIELNKRSHDQRHIITFDPQKREGTSFEWKDLTKAQQAALNAVWLGGVLTPEDEKNQNGADRLEFLRGKGVADTEQDWRKSENFRARSSKLGDIIYSDPVYVGKPLLRYDENAELAEEYGKFKKKNADRTHMIYVGSNDGMLHGFDANDGKEVIAYVPNMLFPKLTQLTSPDYNHLYYVDGPITVGDAMIGKKEWATLLIGGLRAGGQGVFALDITDPKDLGKNKAKDIVKWEFTDNSSKKFGDPDLGYTFGKPLIIRTNNPSYEWVAIFGNGYNNTVEDAYPSATGNAVLYIVDVVTGELVKKIDTGVGFKDSRANNRPNGLAAPMAIDIHGDFKVEYIYAGDLLGNLWKFNIASANENDWGLAYGGEPMFKAINAEGQPQPITTAPIAYKNMATEQGYLIYFGTGKFFEDADAMATNQPTQSLYAIWDKNPLSPKSFGITRNKLLQQEFISQSSEADVQFRKTKQADIDWSSQFGWYLDFIMDGENKGEKQVNTILLSNNTLLFSTTVPQPQEKSCEFGGASWLYFLNATDGGPPRDITLDLDGDGVWSLNEMSNQPSGLLDETLGIVPGPAVSKRPVQLEAQTEPENSPGSNQRRNQVIIDIGYSGAAGGSRRISALVQSPQGRQTWRQLYHFPTR